MVACRLVFRIRETPDLVVRQGFRTRVRASFFGLRGAVIILAVLADAVDDEALALGSQTRWIAFGVPHPTNGHVCATVDKAKHSASQKFFIPSGARSYAILGHPARTEFRHDSCNADHRWGDTLPRGGPSRLMIDDL